MSRKKTKKFLKKGLPPGTLVYTGDYPDREAILHLYQFDAEKIIETRQIPDEIADFKKMIWVDVRGFSDLKLIEKIGRVFHIHPLVLEDVVNVDQRPKFDEYENGLFFILQNPKLNPETLEWRNEQIAIFCGHNFSISFQENPDDTFAPVVSRLQIQGSRIRNSGSDYLSYALLDMVVDLYYPSLDELETIIEDIENQVVERGATNVSKTKIFALKNSLNKFRRTVFPLREVTFKFSKTEKTFISETNRLFFRDLSDHIIYILDGIENLEERLENLQQLYQADVNNRLNNVMRLLAVISTIFMPLSFIAGIFGMNFDRMPMLHDSNGFMVLSTIMLGLALGMLYYFKRKNWI